MRTVYIDADFKCYPTNDGTRIPVETTFFDGKCDTFVEGHRCVPDGATYIREDGVPFSGRAIFPWKPYSELAAAQAQHERDLADRAELEEAFYYLLNGGAV